MSDAPPENSYFDLQLLCAVSSADAVASLQLAVDMSVPRGPAAWPTDCFKKAAPVGLQMPVDMISPDRRPAWIDADIAEATRLRSAVGLPWVSAVQRTSATAVAWDQADSQATAIAEQWVSLDRSIRPSPAVPWVSAINRDALASEHWISLYGHRRPQIATPWATARSNKTERSAVWQLAQRRDRSLLVIWQTGKHPAPGKSPAPVNPGPDPANSCYTPPNGLAAGLLFSSALPASLDLLFSCGNKAPAAAIVIPVRSLYMITNTTTLIREDTGVAIPTTGLQVSIDADSWDWNWSASVPVAARALLVGDYGSLVVLLATINGTLFRLALDRQPRQRQFGSSSMSIGGRGRAMMLDAPFADEVMRYADQAATAQQLMAAALTDNGVPIGWDIDWQLTDWTVPAGVWSHTGTAIEACMAIAGAAGGYIQAHRAEQVLSVLPRYPVAPWEWASVTPDIELPESAVVVESDDPVDKPRYNTVFVAGQEGGLQVHVTRAGTAGDRAAQMVTDPLITHVDAGRQRGLAILGDTGRQRPLTLSLPVFAETGIILPGKFVRYVAGGTSTIGLTRAVSVAADRPRTRQTIILETHDDL